MNVHSSPVRDLQIRGRVCLSYDVSGVDKVLRVWDIDEGGRERVLLLENFIDLAYQTNRSRLNVVPMIHCTLLFRSIIYIN